MQKVKVIYKWILLSVILQVLVLSYFNFFFLNRRSSIEVTSFDTSVVAGDSNIKLPDDASQVKISYSGFYASYLSGGKLRIVDTQNKKERKVISDEEGSLNFYRWLPDRNMVIYSVAIQGAGSSTVKLGTYDLDSGLEKKNQEIKWLPDGSEVDSIELSPLTNVVYVKIKTSETRARIYKFDIMDNLSRIMYTDAGTVVAETNYTDSLVYQDEENVVRIWNGRTRSSKRLPVQGKGVLLKVDSEDRIYVGELNDEGNVEKVLIGKLNDRLDCTFDKTTLKTPVKKEDLIVTNDGEIYEVSRDNKKVTGVGNKTSFNYSGDLIEINSDHVATDEGGTMKLRLLKNQ